MMSEKSLVSEFKWALKKEAFPVIPAAAALGLGAVLYGNRKSHQLGTPSVEIPEKAYEEALMRASDHRNRVQNELDEFRRDFSPSGRYGLSVSPKEYLKQLAERKAALRNAVRSVPLAASDLQKRRAAGQGLRPGLYERLSRSLGAALSSLIPTSPRIGRVV